MIVMSGVSWSYENKLESLYKKEEIPYASLKKAYSILSLNKVINRKIANFRRISDNSKLFSLLTGLSLYDSEIQINSEIEENTGIIACTHEAAAPENEKYFNDYISAGGTMARGNLFVYTLPTSSLGEVAITYQLKGPLFFSNFTETRLGFFLEQAEFMLKTGLTKNIVCIFTDEKAAICMFFTDKHFNSRHLAMETLKTDQNKEISLIDFIQKIKKITKQNKDLTGLR
jgi:hypothetical protein